MEAIIISHLLFDDDIIIFYDAKEEQPKSVNHVLRKYESALCQMIKLTNTSVLFRKRARKDKGNLLYILLTIL